jgi:hypothetical protein
MCLDYELSEKQAAKIIQQARKRGYIRVWKRCDIRIGRRCTGFFKDNLYKKGVIKARDLLLHDGGWYAFLTKEAAEEYFGTDIKVCYAKASWIKRLGKYKWSRKRELMVGIFTHLAFPSWDKGDMTIREFKEMCKAEQKQ